MLCLLLLLLLLLLWLQGSSCMIRVCSTCKLGQNHCSWTLHTSPSPSPSFWLSCSKWPAKAVSDKNASCLLAHCFFSYQEVTPAKPFNWSIHCDLTGGFLSHVKSMAQATFGLEPFSSHTSGHPHLPCFADHLSTITGSMRI